MAFQRLIVAIFCALALLSLGACKSNCEKLIDMKCEDANSQICKLMTAQAKEMTAEQCKNAIIGHESENAIDDMGSDTDFGDDTSPEKEE